MALDTLSLPVLEPLTPTRLQDVTVLALSCLYAGEWSFGSYLELLAVLYYLHAGGSAHRQPLFLMNLKLCSTMW